MVKFTASVELDVTDKQAKALKDNPVDLMVTAQAQGAKVTITTSPVKSKP